MTFFEDFSPSAGSGVVGGTELWHLVILDKGSPSHLIFLVFVGMHALAWYQICPVQTHFGTSATFFGYKALHVVDFGNGKEF